MQLCETLRQHETKTGPLLLPSRARIHLMELCEKPAQLIVRNPDAGVGHSHLDMHFDTSRLNVDPTPARRELDGVGDKIQQHLLDFGRVRDERDRGFHIGCQLYRLMPSQRLNGSPDIVDERPEVDRPQVDLRLSGFNLR